MMPSITAAPRDMPRSGDHPGDQHAQDDQADHHPADVAPELPQVQTQARVIKNDGHGQGHQRLERGPQQPLGVDVGRQGTRDETGRQQHDERRNVQPGCQYLGADGEHENQANAGQDLVGRHARLRWCRGKFF
jgi:hypothetical protein